MADVGNDRRKAPYASATATVKILATVWQRFVRQNQEVHTIAGNLLFF